MESDIANLIDALDFGQIARLQAILTKASIAACERDLGS